MAISVEWFDDLDAVAADAAGALGRAAQPCLFNRIEWFQLTHSHILAHASPAVIRVRDGESAAWLFMIAAGRSTAAPMASWYSLRFGPILSGPHASALLAPLFAGVARRFDHISLHPLPAAAQPSLSASGFLPFATHCSTNWTMDLLGRDFAAYWRDRPARLRNTVSRRARSHPVDIILRREFDAALWDAYEKVYAASWKPAEGSPPFLRALAEQEASAGSLRLGLARNGEGQAVAAQFWLVENGVATIHKLAHREEARAGSPGSLLSHAMFRDAIDGDRVARIDFGLGDEAYKADWTDNPSPVYRIDAYRPASARGVVGIGREIASRLARRRALD